MCGICGYYNFDGAPIGEGVLKRMIKLLHHRGPDESGTYTDRYAGLGHTRLKIIDLERGRQPIPNEDKTKWIVFNGEIFNYIELRGELKKKGYFFRTSSDTEVILHLYEEYGASCLTRLNGQFAFAIWDSRKRELFLARDRFGIEPVYYTKTGRGVVFASEIKAIAVFRGVRLAIDERAVDETFTFWTTIPPKTIFKDVFAILPGHYLVVKGHDIKEGEYWRLDFPPQGEYEDKSEKYYIDNLKALLEDSVRLRLRADVGVGAYLSGGIDSSATAAIARSALGKDLTTFSISFRDRRYDETAYQKALIRGLDCRNFKIECGSRDISKAFPKVVWHAEAPILRTGPAPLYTLSDLARRKGFKVVLAGDGADEFLLGYDIFKEVKARRFWAEEGASRKRPLLLKKLYPYLPLTRSGGAPYLKKFFGKGLERTGGLYYSHMLRWGATSRIKRFFSRELKSRLRGYDCLEALTESLPRDFRKWDYMARAQYLEAHLFLSNFLLSSQGDRMSMAHGVEVRHPFLDHRLVEFCNRVPPRVKMRGLSEKSLLKKAMAGRLPKTILKRPKQPYRAPNIDLSSISAGKMKAVEYFDTGLVSRLVEKLKKFGVQSESDSMALNGILSLQLLHDIKWEKGV